jgi:NADPH2:quinone reductase
VIDAVGMRAIVLTAFGPPDKLQLRDVPRPAPGPGEILVRVVASGTNPVEAKIRAAGSWAKITPPAIIGYDAAGVVEELGAGVRDFAPGDEVFFTPEIFGNQSGTHAEFCPVPAAIVARKPRGLSFAEAAAVPLAGGTAWEAVVRRLEVRIGETLLVHGGAGGVGSFAVQIGKALGARVIATAGPDNQETLRKLGADVAVDYRSEDFVQAALRETSGRGVDAVFDTVGGDNVPRSLPATRPFGRVASILGVQGDLTTAYLRNLTLHGVFLTRERKRLEEMTPVLERGLVKPLIAEVLPLAEAPRAHERLDSKHGRGKIILQVS